MMYDDENDANLTYEEAVAYACRLARMEDSADAREEFDLMFGVQALYSAQEIYSVFY